MGHIAAVALKLEVDLSCFLCKSSDAPPAFAPSRKVIVPLENKQRRFQPFLSPASEDKVLICIYFSEPALASADLGGVWMTLTAGFPSNEEHASEMFLQQQKGLSGRGLHMPAFVFVL